MTLEEGQSQTSGGEKMRQPGNRRSVMEGELGMGVTSPEAVFLNSGSARKLTLKTSTVYEELTSIKD